MILFLVLFLIVVSVTSVIDLKKRGYRLLSSLVISGIFLAWGIIGLAFIKYNPSLSKYMDSTYNIIGVYSIGLCIILIPYLVVYKFLTKKTKKVTDMWKCPHCGQENSNHMSVCDCGTRKPQNSF